MTLTLPNSLTLLRIALIPVMFIIYWLPFNWVNPACAIIFGLAALTDWFDGYFARKLDQGSAFGAFLDPVADKLMVVIALLLILSNQPKIWMAIPVTIIIGRELIISALREWMAEVGQRTAVKVSLVGKVKTSFQMLAIIFLLWERDFLSLPIYNIGYVLLQIAAALTLFSMLIYLRAAWPHMSAEDVD